jgi:hypothetical protein
MYGSTRSLTSVLNGMAVQLHSSPGKTRLGGNDGRSRRVRKTGIRSPDSPARSVSLHRMRYDDPHFIFCIILYMFFLFHLLFPFKCLFALISLSLSAFLYSHFLPPYLFLYVSVSSSWLQK